MSMLEFWHLTQEFPVLGYSELFLPPDVMNITANETYQILWNTSQARHNLHLPLISNSRKMQIQEIFVFFWLTDPLLATPQFSDLMSGDTYLLLLCLLQFVTETLMAKYLNKGHILRVGNWYLNPNLSDCFHKQQIDTHSTVKRNWKETPEFTQKLEKGQSHNSQLDTQKRSVHVHHTT
jgi:hypothetical protein